MKVRSLRKAAKERHGPGTPIARFHHLMGELEKRFPDSHPFSPYPSEGRYLNAIDQKIAMKDAAIETAVTALDDWLNTYAPEFCNEGRVEEAQNRLQEYGTLYYIADVLQQCRTALKG